MASNTTKKVMGAFILFALLFALGWYPQYAKRTEVERERAALAQELETTTRALAVARFQNRAGRLWNQIERDDYSTTAEVATAFFTDLRSFTNSLPRGPEQESLERSLASRDAIIAGLAKADPAVKSLVRELFLGFPKTPAA